MIRFPTTAAPLFAINGRRFVALHVGIDTEVSPELIEDQFTVRAAFFAQGESVPEMSAVDSQAGASGSWLSAGASYCYRIELHSLIDDSTDVREGCVPHGDLGAVGTFDLPSDDIAANLAACAEPPEGYEAAWCQGVRAKCAETEAPRCATAKAQCLTLDSGGDDSKRFVDSDGTDRIDDHATSTSACSATGVHGADGATGLLGLLAFACCVLVTRARGLRRAITSR